MNNSKSIRPLDGIKIISLEHAIAAPFCTRQLADMGARVIKIERPGVGDFARNYDKRVKGLSSHFVWTNRSKESLTLDLKNDEAMNILLKLLEDADVLIQNLAPGAAARMGLSYTSLTERFPKLIVCDITGYGIGGPYELKKAYDLLIQSEGGFLSVTGGECEEQMAKAGCSIADIAAGMYAYTNILSALLLRNKTGHGSHIDISMLESLLEWMGYPLYYSYDGASPPPRAGASHSTIYPYGPFIAGDGQIVMLGLQNEREWKSFCDLVLCNPELAEKPQFHTNPLRSENRIELKEIILNEFSKSTADEITSRLEKAKIANAKVNSMQDVWDHPQLASRERWCTINSPAGELKSFLPPGKNSKFSPRMGNVPALGENTEMILNEIGYSQEEIGSLKNRKII